MKKVLLIALVTIGLSTTIHAGEFFVEASVGELTLESSTAINSGTPTKTTSTSTFQGITIAQYIDDYFISISLSTITFEVDAAELSARPSYYISAAANYIVDNDSDFLPFGGVKLSYVSQEIGGYKSLGFDQDISTIQTVFVSANLGITYDITEQLQFKAEYSHPLASIPVAVTLTQAGITVDTEVEPKGSWSAGIIYNF